MVTSQSGTGTNEINIVQTYDFRVRNKRGLKSIQRYIQDNSLNWSEDKNNPEKF